ncbi:MAG TPA: cupin domain-containing protein [Chitinophagaceae bacterium]|nr:cupin domain-containing protein [Chitinophagaceae bacterium]
MKEPVIILPLQKSRKKVPDSARGKSFVIHEWRGSGPPYLHVHYEDDEAWHVLEGTLTFKFRDKTIDACPGTTVFVPAGVPHTYFEKTPSRYLAVLTPVLNQLIAELHTSPLDTHKEIMKKYASEILD